MIDGYQGHINFDFHDIEINVHDCNKNQIKMYSTNQIPYCENPICKDSCPVDISARCIYNESLPINDKNSNICECYNGYSGENCSLKTFIDFRYI